jgi:hypothetical protein
MRMSTHPHPGPPLEGEGKVPSREGREIITIPTNVLENA